MLEGLFRALGVPCCAVRGCGNPAVTRVALSESGSYRQADVCVACLARIPEMMRTMNDDLVAGRLEPADPAAPRLEGPR